MSCSEAYLWICKANELIKSADLLWAQFFGDLKAFKEGSIKEEPFIGSTALMLYGFAIENLVKAGLAARGAATTRKATFALKSHQLIELFEQLGLSLSKNDMEYLERLEHFMVWAGRYPIPLTAQDLYPRQFCDGSHCALHFVSTKDAEAVLMLIERVKTVLPTEEEALLSYMDHYGKHG
ncbi:hypothetical protein [Syntrophus gentianae]|nr:hypothetical protein [Syntrophus gentianae]